MQQLYGRSGRVDPFRLTQNLITQLTWVGIVLLPFHKKILQINLASQRHRKKIVVLKALFYGGHSTHLSGGATMRKAWLCLMRKKMLLLPSLMPTISPPTYAKSAKRQYINSRNLHLKTPFHRRRTGLLAKWPINKVRLNVRVLCQQSGLLCRLFTNNSLSLKLNWQRMVETSHCYADNTMLHNYWFQAQLFH